MDPLKPFSSSIRALWEQSTRRVEDQQRATSTNAAGVPQPAQPVAAMQPPQTLQGRLRTRLASLPVWDTARARELFVESVVLSELGETLATDPAFYALVQRVSQQLGTDSSLSLRLDLLLKMVRDGQSLT